MNKVLHDNGCVRCGQIKSRKWHNSKDGGICDNCYEKEYRIGSPSYKEYHSKYHKEYKNIFPEKYMYARIKSFAKKNNIPFNLEIEDIVIPECCPILNIPLFRGEGKMSPNSPTVDKIIPSLGYVKGNICVISSRANRKKDDSSLEELEAIVAYIKQKSNLQ